ncbi:MAG: DMT family transporter [Pirellulales bacterium]|nr:DMT family transporter [Pirellulales bacterium]
MVHPPWLRHMDTCGVLALSGTILCWAAIPVLLRELTHVVDSWTANGIRFPAASILYWPSLYYFYCRGELTRHVVRQCLIPAACILTGQFFWAAAPYFMPASSIGFFIRLTMVFSIIFAMLFIPHERRLLRVRGFYWGLAISTTGFVILAISGMSITANIQPMGIVCMVISSLSLGMYAVSIRLFLKNINPILSFGIVAQFASIALLLAMGLFGDWRAVASLSWWSWILLALSSLLGIAWSHTLLYIAIQRLGPSITAGIQNLTPFITALLAMVFLHEGLSLIQWLGGITVVLGVIWLLKSHAVLQQNESA